MVLGLTDKQTIQIATAHIYPKHQPNGLKSFGLNPSDIGNPRNSLRLVKEIELAFDRRDLTIIEKRGQLRIFFINKKIMSRAISSACGRTFVPGRILRPGQQEFGLNDEAVNNCRLYVNSLLDILLDAYNREKIKNWLEINPVAPETPSVRSLTATQFIYTFVKHYGESSTHGNNSDRLQVAVEDLSSVILLNRTILVGELITHVLQLKPQIAVIVGHLLDLARKEQILSIDHIADGISSLFEILDRFSGPVWQHMGELLGMFIVIDEAPLATNILILKKLMKKVSPEDSKEIIGCIIRSARNVSSKSKVICLWKSSGLTFDDFYDWLLNPTTSEDNETVQSLASATQLLAVSHSSTFSFATNSASADVNLINLFRTITEQHVDSTAQTKDIHRYIQEKMNPSDKYYIHNIVLSYLESCIAVHESNNPIIDQSAAQQRAHILKSVIDHDKEKEVQAINGIQTFVIKLKHPPKMARSLFDLFYDEDCVSDRAFLEWFQNVNGEESNDYNQICQSVKEFFDWLMLVEDDTGEEDDDEHNFHRRSE
ncbi:unnamed protein product [Adineta ricciae]|uniref:W2 domain-containing protein n=1 Tax=Adineta ricciae TaxID=249248 RepID=A0A815KS61_ADIRI|nr:unnamed protein product [Adineta ricciae]